ncbi:uncharacterized protein LOC119671259 [Teleopsis dalmanni]|uniref:uncharacterized protein LOC119671259 n=1 Tax=Teleopsis dalmanni TaxID=139649 RepID=UPI0018CE1500|nr:uncharacterized protein LOC119671259 [Teleopsis dalmanni]
MRQVFLILNKLNVNMNVLGENIYNYVFISNQDCENENVYKLCLNKIKTKETVLLMTRDKHNILTLVKDLKISKKDLQYLIIMYFKSITEITHKLLELHDWVYVPTLVVVDFCPFIASHKEISISHENAEKSGKRSLLEKIYFCIATLFNYMESVQRRQNKSNQDKMLNRVNIYSFVLLIEQQEFLTRAQLDLIISLYFYKNQHHNDFDAIQKSILSNEISCELE